MKRKKFLLLTLLSLVFITLLIVQANAEDNYIVLDVEGEGKNRNEAIEAAWLSGIRQAVGSFIDAKTELNNEEFTERIIAYSRGLVEKYEVTGVDDSKIGEGIYKIKLRLWIVQDLLRDGAKHASSGSAEIAFSPADLKKKQDELNAKAAKELEAKNAAAETAKRKSQTGAELLEAMLNRYKPEDFLSCYIPGKPEMVKGKTDVFSLNVELNFNEKLYKENFIPDLIQVLDQISSKKKNTLLVKYKNELRNLAAKKDLETTPNPESIILRANDLGKDYQIAVYNKPENFGCRLYGFSAEDADKILGYEGNKSEIVLSKFRKRAARIKGLLLELLDEDKEVIETIEKRFDIAFLTTNKNGNTWSFQPTMLIKNNSVAPPDNVSITQNSNGSVTIVVSMNDRSISSSSVINEKSEKFPFTISPSPSFYGNWYRGSNSSYFTAKSTNLKQGTNYTVTIKEKVDGLSIPNGGKSFTFGAVKDGWEEKKQFVIPVELELPEEILPVIKNIKVSLLME